MKNIRDIAQQVEDEFGLVEINKTLDNEVTLGTIDEIPVCASSKSDEFGNAKATITNKRLIIDGTVLETRGPGRYTFYYETWLNEIQGIKVKSYDSLKRKAYPLGIACVGVLVVFLLVMGILMKEVVRTGCLAAAGVSLLLVIPFLPRKFNFRSFELTFQTLSGDVVIGNTKNSDLFVAISIDSVDKLTLLARGVRKAQHAE